MLSLLGTLLYYYGLFLLTCLMFMGIIGVIGIIFKIIYYVCFWPFIALHELAMRKTEPSIYYD